MNPRLQLLADLEASSGRELGVTEWRHLNAAEADTFDISAGQAPDFSTHPAGPVRPLPVSRFHLVALLSSFASEVGLPTPTDAHITALNYGYNDIAWHADVQPGDAIRDHVSVIDVTQRAPDRYLLRARHEVESRDLGKPVMTATALSFYLLLDGES